VAFGAKFSVLQAGKLPVGDEVTVLSRGEPEL
jgi:MOSC domain-containing protein YiiM